jgi:hypothetical protein
MDFVDEVKSLAAKTSGLLNYIKTEAATRTALVEPFIRALGYDTSDPTEVVPEFGADLDVPGVPKNKKIDYGILKEGKPIILIECKCHTDKLIDGYKQLFHYGVATDTRIGVLTNGVIYRFYAELDKPGRLDEAPFLELDMLNLQEPLVEELKKLTKPALSVSEMLTAASELKYVGGILKILSEQTDENKIDENFAKYFFQQLCPDRAFAGSVKPQWRAFTHRALNQFVTEEIKRRLGVSNEGGSPRGPSTTDPAGTERIEDGDKTPPAELSIEKQIITTPEEMEGFYIVKSILRGVVEPSRIGHKDVQAYFGVLFDSKVNKPICRFYFSNPKNMRLGLFTSSDNGKQEEKVSVTGLDEIYQHADTLKAIVAYYDQK